MVYEFRPANKPPKVWPQNPVALAVLNIKLAIPDLIMAAHETRTTSQAMAIHDEIESLMIELQAASDVSLDMATRNAGVAS